MTNAQIRHLRALISAGLLDFVAKKHSEIKKCLASSSGFF